MKNVFSINVTTNETPIEKFQVKKLSEELERKSSEMDDTLASIKKASSVPVWLSIAFYVFAAVALMVFVNFVDAAIEGKFSTAYANAGWLIYVGAGCLVLAVAICLYTRYRRKTTESSPAAQSAVYDSESLIKRCYEDLGVPQEADCIDVFLECFQTKKGKVKRVRTVFAYANVDSRIFKDDNNLYIADTERVCAFPLSSFSQIVAIKKNVSFNSWNKQEPFNKGYYKQFKIRLNNYGMFFVKPYYSVRLSANGEEFEILIPSYELNTLLKYVNLNVTQENK